MWGRARIIGVGSGVLCAAAAAVYATQDRNVIIGKRRLSSDCVSVKDGIPSIIAPNDVINDNVSNEAFYNVKLNDSISKARDLCLRAKDVTGAPGLVMHVAVNGKTIHHEGFGYSDMENNVPMKPNAVFRIASISKCMTAAMMGKLLEEGKIDLDVPIQTYVPKFPEKNVDGKKVTITTRNLMSHLSGIRHYQKKGEKEAENEMTLTEYFIKDHFDSLEKSLEIFQNDELLHEPGTKYFYTTHGWTVVSAIIEEITKVPFDSYSKAMFNFWGLQDTYLDENDPLIYNRIRYYSRKGGRIVNCPYVDNSYKWAGGGFLSTTEDLVRFAHILLSSLQQVPSLGAEQPSSNTIGTAPFLKASTIKELWTGNPVARPKLFKNDPQLGNPDRLYGLGFYASPPMSNGLFCKESEHFTVTHGGGAIGTSSMLLLRFPKNPKVQLESSHPLVVIQSPQNEHKIPVNGLVVVMFANLTGAGLLKTAGEIADLFQWLL